MSGKVWSIVIQKQTKIYSASCLYQIHNQFNQVGVHEKNDRNR